MTNKSIDLAYDEGCDAAEATFANRNMCPYRFGNSAWVSWTMGFDTVMYGKENKIQAVQ